MIKISIIIPIYNKSVYLEECIENVCAQTLKDIEIICVDDGSTDGSAQLVADYAHKENRVKLILQSNLGAGAARNVGIKAATGEYIAFLDADDFYPSKDTLARMYAAAEANNADICGGSFCEIRGNERITEFDGATSGNVFKKERWVDFNAYQFDYGFYRFIYRREFLLQNSLTFPNYRRYQDPPFMLQAFAAAGKFYAIPDVTYCYRVSECPVNWTAEKVLDLLCGIEDNLRFSSDYSFGKVHALNYYRLCNDFCGVIVDTALRKDESGEILKKLIAVQSVVSEQILKDSGLFSADKLGLSRPLAELIAKLSAQSAQLYNEGWFINKKLFRAYTLPVRSMGKLARKIRHRK